MNYKRARLLYRKGLVRDVVIGRELYKEEHELVDLDKLRILKIPHEGDRSNIWYWIPDNYIFSENVPDKFAAKMVVEDVIAFTNHQIRISKDLIKHSKEHLSKLNQLKERIDGENTWMG